jgi:hypothetical protein
VVEKWLIRQRGEGVGFLVIAGNDGTDETKGTDGFCCDLLLTGGLNRGEICAEGWGNDKGNNGARWNARLLRYGVVVWVIPEASGRAASSRPAVEGVEGVRNPGFSRVFRPAWSGDDT